MSQLIVTRQGFHGFGRHIPCAIGRGGILGDKREGDGGTPRGDLTVMGLFYRPDRMPAPTPWAEPILPGDLWSDASDDQRYNQLVRTPYAPSHEKMRRADPLYDAVLITDWNWPVAKAGRGSAIFLHIWRRPRYPTEGCIAFSKANFRWLLPRLAPGSVLSVRG